MAQDMILEVKRTVAKVIERKLHNHSMPGVINEFINGPWKEVMKIIGIRDGFEGKAWCSAMAALDNLICSVQPKMGLQERQRQLKLIPGLLQALQEGLILICYEEEEISAFLKTLEKIHLCCFRRDAHSMEAGMSTSLSSSGPDSEDIFRQIDTQADKHRAFKLDVRDPALTKSPHFAAVKSMPLGTWVEFTIDGVVKRGKLVWKCEFTGEFTFLDRMYKVIADITMRDLIMELEGGKARITKDLPFIDRAMDAVVSGVKQYIGRDYGLVRAVN